MWLADTGDMLIGVDYSIPLSFDVFNVHGHSKVLYHVLEALLPVAHLEFTRLGCHGHRKWHFNLGQGKDMKFCIGLGNFQISVQGPWKVWKFDLDVANYFRCFPIDKAILFLKLSELSFFLLIHCQNNHHAWFMKIALFAVRETSVIVFVPVQGNPVGTRFFSSCFVWLMLFQCVEEN